MRFSRQVYWSRLPFPSVGDLPNTGINPLLCLLQAGSLPVSLLEKKLARVDGKPPLLLLLLLFADFFLSFHLFF